MARLTKHSMFAAAAIGVAVLSAALAHRTGHAVPVVKMEAAPPTIDAFALARLMADAPPDVVVITLDDARHPLRFAQPAALWGATDDALVQNAPEHRRIVLLGEDVVRVDRLARRLRLAGRDVRVLAGGLQSWDVAMADDPPAPPAGANGTAWQTYRDHLALRHAFGDKQAAAATMMAAPIAPVAAPAAGAPKKREGC
ncbi:MAG: hypothetical protein HYV09_20015 [Deltaproteobacteria bacterium]|nr:hypothetical protein [Deltaproteobacteria bacterium]